MTDNFTAACVQHSASDNVNANTSILVDLIKQSVSAGADFVCLPEACDFLSGSDGEMQAYAQPAKTHKTLEILTECARSHSIWLLIGSLTMKSDTDSLVNRSLLVDPKGRVRAHYDKIHMFDACIPGMKESKESNLYRPGTKAQLAKLPWGTLGLSICYDLRFPHLYRCLAQGGASLLSVPAAFMQTTGKAHWHALLRSRAIENGCFVFAPAQWGNHYDNRFSYGHSLIVDPWGQVLADAGDGDGVAVARIEMRRVTECREAISSLQHDRPFDLDHSAA